MFWCSKYKPLLLILEFEVDSEVHATKSHYLSHAWTNGISAVFKEVAFVQGLAVVEDSYQSAQLQTQGRILKNWNNSKACHKWPLTNRQNKHLNDKW